MRATAALPVLLGQLSWPELRHHPLRHAAAVLAVTLGVALAFAVQLINGSALAEFGAAVRSVNGEPDLSVRAGTGGFDEAVYGRVAMHPQVSLASPVIEIDTYALDASGRRRPIKLLGLDPLVAPALSPGLLPRVDARAVGTDDRLAILDPTRVFLNAAAERTLGLQPGDRLQLQSGLGQRVFAVAGRVAAGGAALAVTDIAGAQTAFDRLGRIDRLDLRLAPGADAAALQRELTLPEGLRAATPQQSEARLSNLSRAYRVNLTVLALVALFTGAFLVFSVLSLSVAKRQPQFALLGVLGLAARDRLGLVLAEALVLGGVGSALGLAAGTALAYAALHWLGGDLGGGYFPGVAPSLRFDALAALIYGALGVAAALVGAWLPARSAQRLAPAQGLKGLGDVFVARARGTASPQAWAGPALMLAGALLALLPPIGGLPFAAYVAVALLLVGGIACVPAGVGLLLKLAPRPSQPLLLLAFERARRLRHSATIAVAGVVASLALAVALTVMVASFRDAVTQWLDVVLPADLYVRTAPGGAPGAEGAWLPPDFVEAALAMPEVARGEALRALSLPLDPARPAVTLIARPLADPARSLPLVGELLPADAALPSLYVSEAMVTLYDARPGTTLALPLAGGSRRFFVRGVWRDYARQFGAVAVDRGDFVALTGDDRVNDLALSLMPGAALDAVQQRLRERAAQLAAPDGTAAPQEPLEFARASEIRAISLRIFDRSFAVTYWLQAVAIGIGLFGIAASGSAQVLARRKEFGLLAHLGFTRRQVLAVVAGEGFAWTTAGALLGTLLGLAVSVVLVHVVNPQSFHWTMELRLPLARLAALALAVVAAGTLTAVVAARHAASRDAIAAVKEDW
ncbi:MAG TPA: FtsX-like permease family protein [Methylibium sp.]|uniref:ABC transporter permease n=1 Tax=Methylibium sp. TaxID=2067992 RepID=UPI002DB84310|nr:FtsX-like permease family protein [Methylibium sp.]HEU4460268.1 FtsX-like permease family protein [Methylibium sp.]